ncbi:MazG nucleotide pyrophosphohydrolase domain-containing protein [Acinetobacter pittii]|uniref:MazG nucleotide pyrophosphohydrolase domain-containing protein n=1 Tax=Acinetobacter pittii TaxID=48296 RepID=UPI0026EE0B39|nr:MazG nucleotide pyrophosphohydrolase domain-containing protein [Acinetobacter pittii]MDO7244969.1 MazG nucleotide pyrophosphohydrolase domain-containing protein [Acinetobacter pittii]
MKLKDIQEMQRSFDKSHQMKLDFYEKIDEKNLPALEHLIVCLLGELGEFSNLLKKVVRGDYELNEVKSLLDEELVDVFIYLIKISNQFDVDLENGYLNKLEKNKVKFEKSLK